MQPVVYVLLISLGAYLLLGIFHFIIYLQQNDQAFRSYAFYLFSMVLFNVLRLLDARLTDFFPLSYETIETFDPVVSNLAFLMYANFLGTLLNIQPSEKVLYTYWRFIRFFIPAVLILFVLMRISGADRGLSNWLITIASLLCMAGGLVMTLRLFKLRKDPFYLLVIAGTLTAVLGVLSGFIVNVVVFRENIAFAGIYYMEIAQMIESAFISAAMGYRLKMAFRERDKAQLVLLEETRKREALANETARLLQQELSVKEMQNQISRDLHDDVGASLSSLQIYSELAGRVMSAKPAEARLLLEQITEKAGSIIEHMGHIVWAIQSADNQVQSLDARIRQISYDLLSPRNIYSFIELEEEAISRCNQPEVRRGLVLIVKEALNNAAKYSAAEKVQVRLQLQNHQLLLSIEDDGKGFDVTGQPGGNGIRNIRARAEKLGGTVCIQSAPGSGTRISCLLPVPIISDTGPVVNV